MKEKYTHTVSLHNLAAPREIVPFMMEIISPTSVVDIGCGLGTFLKVFKESGIKEVLGVDGNWCNKELLFKNILPEEFLEMNMEASIKLNKRFDMVVCLEVAEHLSAERADSFVKDLTSLSDVILFSAAIPRQGGVNHLNEQWLSYWEEKFTKAGYIVQDVLKPFFWNNPKVFWFYKQNMVLVTKSDYVLKTDVRLQQNFCRNVIHPELFQLATDYKRKKAIRHYAKLLARAIRYRLFSK